MKDSDFLNLVSLLDQTVGKTHGQQPHRDLLKQIRVHFPEIKADRYRGLASDLIAAQERNTPLHKISPQYQENNFGQKFGDAGRGNARRFRALLLKWLWIHHYEQAQDYLARWDVKIPIGHAYGSELFHSYVICIDRFNSIPYEDIWKMMRRRIISASETSKARKLHLFYKLNDADIDVNDIRFMTKFCVTHIRFTMPYDETWSL